MGAVAVEICAAHAESSGLVTVTPRTEMDDDLFASDEDPDCATGDIVIRWDLRSTVIRSKICLPDDVARRPSSRINHGNRDLAVANGDCALKHEGLVFFRKPSLLDLGQLPGRRDIVRC